VRPLPQDPAAEQATLGCILLRPPLLDACVEAGLKPEDFSQPGHRALYGALLEMGAADEPVDMVTLPARLQARRELDLVGGLRALTDYSAAVGSSHNLPAYISAVRRSADLRSLIVDLDSALQAASEPGADPDAVLEQAESAVYALRSSGQGKRAGWQPIGRVLDAAYSALEARHKNPSGAVGIPTGLRDLDELLTGLHPTDLVILAARPAMGKSAFAMGAAVNAARTGHGVGVLSLEMSSEQLGGRVLTSEARINGHRARTGRLHSDEWEPLLGAVEGASSLPLWIDDSAVVGLSQIRAGLRRLRSRSAVHLLVIDYLQLLAGSASRQAQTSREREVAELARGLKLLAKSEGIAVLLLAQLNRECEKRRDKRPMLSDLRESGAIEQDADTVMFLYRDEVYNSDEQVKGEAEVIVAKQRHGATGTVRVAWSGEHCRFRNREPRARPADSETMRTARQGYQRSQEQRERYP
jgi:replicative DNA helicase